MWSSLLFILFAAYVDASQITKVKGNKAIIVMEDETFEEGDKVLALDENGKKKASLLITKVKGNKAQATIEKGRVSSGMSVTSSNTSSKKSSARGSKRSTGKMMGIIGGISQNTMVISTGVGKGTYTSSSFVLSGMVDLPISKALIIRGKAGLNQYAVAKDSTKAAFSYLGFEGGLNWNLSKSLWIGGGGAFLLTMSKASKIPGLSTNASTNSFFFVGVGGNISISRNQYIPVSVDYALFPGGAGITANSLLLRAGYAWDF